MTFKVVFKVSKTRVKDSMIPYSLIFRKFAKIQSQRYKKSYFQLRNYKSARKKQQKAWICSSWTHIAFDFPFSINYSQCFFFNSILNLYEMSQNHARPLNMLLLFGVQTMSSNILLLTTRQNVHILHHRIYMNFSMKSIEIASSVNR